MESRPLISFITPVYNSEEFLAECIDSVLKQTNPDWELILIDDGSKDNSGDICDNYSKMDSRITVIHQQNAGQLISRIKGINCAKGLYCTGLDSDDYLEEDCVEVLVNALKSHPCDIICWNIRRVLNGQEISRVAMPRYGLYSNADFLLYMSSSYNHSFCNKLIKSELMRESYYGDIPDSRRAEDYIQICPSVCMAKSIYAIDNALYNYRQIDSSVTHVANGKHILDILKSTNCVLDIITHYGMLSSEFKNSEFNSLFNSVAYHLKNAIKDNAISPEEAEAIRKDRVFKQLKAYESSKYSSWDLILLMKLFRYKFDALIHLIYS